MWLVNQVHHPFYALYGHSVQYCKERNKLIYTAMNWRACSAVHGPILNWRAQQWNVQGWPNFLFFFESLFKYVNIINGPLCAFTIFDNFPHILATLLLLWTTVNFRQQVSASVKFTIHIAFIFIATYLKTCQGRAVCVAVPTIHTK